MRKSLVSLVALGLFLGAPAMAQTTTDDATNQSTQQQTSGPSAEQFERMLGEYEARSEIQGHIVRAITPDGNHVLVLVGPRNLEPDGSVEANDSDVSSRFEEGGFTDVAILGGGIAGMTTAVGALDHGLDAVVVERDTILGGRVVYRADEPR